MKSNNLLISLAFCITVLISHSGRASITKPTYFPPNPKIGNAINLQYDDIIPATGTYFNKISVTYRFNQLSPSPTGVKYVATDFWIQSAPHVGDYMYMGVNPPQKDAGYGGQVHFSYFGALGGTIDTPSTCNRGADSGSGITCAVGIRAKQGDIVKIVATVLETNASATHVQGRVYYYNSEKKTETIRTIGQFWVKRGNAAIAYPGGWIEGTSDPNYCADLVKTSITYSPVSVIDISGKSRSIQIDTLKSAYCGALAIPTRRPGYVQISIPQMTPPSDREYATAIESSAPATGDRPIAPEPPGDGVKSKAGR